MERRGNVYGVEGLDGVGKTDVARLLAEQTESKYYYWTEHSGLKKWRKYFDNAPTNIRFLFYTAVSIDTYEKVERLKTISDVFIDRTVASTIAYHIALGINSGMLTVIPRCTLDQIDTLIYLTAGDDVRKERMIQRGKISDQAMTEADRKSLIFSRQVDSEYRKIMPDRTLIVETDNRTQQEVVDHVKGILYAK